MYSVSADNPKLSLFNDSGTQITYNALLHYRIILSPNTMVGSVDSLIILPKYSLLFYLVEPYPNFFFFCWAISNSNTLLSFTLFWYIAELVSVFLHCWAILNLNTLLEYSESQYVAEKNPSFTMLSISQFQYIAELYAILTLYRGIPFVITLLSCSQILLECWAHSNLNTLLSRS